LVPVDASTQPVHIDISAEKSKVQQLLEQQLATHSDRAQQACLLGTSRLQDELAAPEFLISISSGELNVLTAVALAAQCGSARLQIGIFRQNP